MVGKEWKQYNGGCCPKALNIVFNPLVSSLQKHGTGTARELIRLKESLGKQHIHNKIFLGSEDITWHLWIGDCLIPLQEAHIMCPGPGLACELASAR